ncbi:MAG: hypothetical protein KC912_04240 [Proteobacteria bacterium]|nr:hypothetical protein [Pseudomonadota bacterium]
MTLLTLALTAFAGIPTVADLPLPAGEPSAVHLYVPGATSEADLKIKAKGGDVRTVKVGSGGLVVLGVVAAADAETMVIKVKGPGTKDALQLPIESAVGAKLEVIVEPGRLRMGRGGAIVKIKAEGLPDNADIGLAASIGDLGPIARTATGWLAPWTPPARVKGPLPVLFTASDLANPGGVYGSAMLEIGVASNLKVAGPMQGEVSVSIGSRDYGKKPLGQRTSTVFEVVRFPSDTTADVLASSLDDGDETRSIELPPTGTAQVRFAPVPKDIGWPAGREVTLMLAAVDNTGQPLDDPSSLELSGPGKVRIEPIGEGWFAVKFQAPTGTEPWSVTAKLLDSVTWMGGRSVVDLPRAEVSVNPTPVASGSGNAQVIIGSRSSQGQQWAGTFAAIGEGFAVAGDAEVSADGTSIVPIVTRGANDLAVCVDPMLEATGLAPVRVRVWSDRTAIDDGEAVFVHAVAEDALGLPVPATVTLTSDRGSLVPVVSSDRGHSISQWSGNGIEGPITLSASLGELSDTSALWVGGGGRGAAPVGTQAEADAERKWRAAAPCVAVPRTTAAADADATPEPAESAPEPTEAEPSPW